jgi:hypothetical protein
MREWHCALRGCRAALVGFVMESGPAILKLGGRKLMCSDVGVYPFIEMDAGPEIGDKLYRSGDFIAARNVI